MKIRCMIIDDEPLARQGLREYISDVDFLELAGEASSAMKATEPLSNEQVQLLFLDIQMPRITGLDFFKSLRNPPPVIFTTAYPQYALEGFEVNALDYLVKPFTFERFLKAAMKAKEYYEVRESNMDQPKESEFFFIKADNKLVKIRYDEILYVEALQNYVNIHTVDRKYMTYLTFKAVEDYLPSEKFLKVHKSYIVAASQIDSIEGNEIRIGTQYIPISRNQKEEVMEKLLKNRFLKR
jgi:DNA-binding LytR/AlgR family response regulator